MTTTLKKVISRVGRLEDSEQDAIANLLLEELSWNKSFKKSQSQLASLAEEALAEYKTGKTIPMHRK